MLDVSEGTVRNLVKNGDLPEPVKVAGTATRWLVKDVEAYIHRLVIEAAAKSVSSQKKNA